jgi:ABC-type branched-subunit amino acid transport system ATPase component
MPKLLVKDLSIDFGGIHALRRVNLEVGEKSFVGLMGPNGAGKTTLINCISGIYPPSEGSITFDGHEILKARGDEVVRYGIARTFQDLNFFNSISDMLVIDYMRLGQFDPRRLSVIGDGFQIRGAASREHDLKVSARDILEFFRQAREYLEPPEIERNYPIILGREGAPDLIDAQFQPIGSLSFAWRRRLDLARALVSKPKLLLLDEPAQGLPPSEIENLGKILKFIQAEFGVSALIVEHNIETLMAISDRVVAMNLGEVIAAGTPDEVRQNQHVINVYLGAMETAPADPENSPVGTEATAKPEKTQVPVLEVKGLDVHYGHAQAIFSASISVQEKQIVSILGTNGSGKSTVLKAIAGVEKPTYGEILFRGEPLPPGFPEFTAVRGIQYVPQGHVVFAELTVLENLKIGSYVFEKRGAKFKDGLERILYYFPSLKDSLKVQAASLSGGQQQMLAIGQAIMSSPDILLLDEPSLGLSPDMVNTLFSIIKKISAKEGCAVLIVEQNVNKALELSEYVYLMSSGVIMAEGPAGQLRKSDDTVKKYLGFR